MKKKDSRPLLAVLMVLNFSKQSGVKSWLSCGRIIRLLAHLLLPPPPPSSVNKLSLFLSPPVCRRPSLQAGEGKGEKCWYSIL
jgi:hypothetical protein